MNRRRDALVAAAEVILSVRDVATAVGVRATCGVVEVNAGASNIVPGKVSLAMDVRGENETALSAFWYDLRAAIEGIRSRNDISAKYSRSYWLAPATTDRRLQDHIREAAATLKLRSMSLSSGAGHDAMALAAAGVPIGMVFIPSVEGISHSPDELSRTPDCANGAAMLATLIQRLAS
jgi:acetylornithine deacetylase/succinyl-diaminopimelate desuccinylase-like protein